MDPFQLELDMIGWEEMLELSRNKLVQLDKQVKHNKLLKIEKSDMQKRVLVTNTVRLAKKDIKNIQIIEEVWLSNMREKEISGYCKFNDWLL